MRKFFIEEYPEEYQLTRKKIATAFRSLRKKGFIAKINFMCCMNCGSTSLFSDLVSSEKYSSYVFWHNQDEKKFQETGQVYLAYGGLDYNEEIGKEIKSALEEQELKVIWNGLPYQRILVHCENAYDQ